MDSRDTADSTEPHVTTPQTTNPIATRAGPSDAPAVPRPGLSAWERFSFSAMHALLSAMLKCVSLRGLYRLGRLFGGLEWLINYKRRRRFARTLGRVLRCDLSAADRRRHTREHFMRTRCDKIFYLIVDCLPREKAAALMTIENEAVLDDLVARGKGVYFAMSHHGPQHLAAMFMALKGFKVAGVRDRREGGIRRYIQDRLDRRSSDFQRMRVLFADGYPREIYRCFKDGFLIGSAMDVGRLRAPHQRFEEVAVFGEKRSFLSGPLRVAIRCGAPAIQTFIVPQPGFRYRLDVVATLVDPADGLDEDAAVASAMQTYAANLEKYIRKQPALLTRA